MMPGRSLLPNTSGRSMAPVASTTCWARIFHSADAADAAGARRQVVGDPLDQRRGHVVVVIAEGGGAGQHP